MASKLLMEMTVTAFVLMTLVIQDCWGFHRGQGNAGFVHEFGQSIENVLRNEYASKQGRSNQLQGFSWANCQKNTTGDLVEVQSLSISPDPLYFPGDLTVSTAFTIKKILDAPLKATVVLQKKIGSIWLNIPCIENFGSCTYDDVCQLLSQIGDQCPPQLVEIGFTCSCPIKSKAYKLKAASFDISAAVIPEGDYKIEAHLTLNDSEVVCLDIALTVG